MDEQDQTVKVAEAQVLELEFARLRSENADLKSQVAGIAGVEDKRKKSDERVAVLEAKVLFLFSAQALSIQRRRARNDHSLLT